MFKVEIYKYREYQYTLDDYPTREEALRVAAEFNDSAPEGVEAVVTISSSCDPVVLTDKYPGDDAFGNEPVSVLGDAKYTVSVYEYKGGGRKFQFSLGTFYTEAEARFVADEYNITAADTMSAEVEKLG